MTSATPRGDAVGQAVEDRRGEGASDVDAPRPDPRPSNPFANFLVLWLAMLATVVACGLAAFLPPRRQPPPPALITAAMVSGVWIVLSVLRPRGLATLPALLAAAVWVMRRARECAVPELEPIDAWPAGMHPSAAQAMEGRRAELAALGFRECGRFIFRNGVYLVGDAVRDRGVIAAYQHPTTREIAVTMGGAGPRTSGLGGVVRLIAFAPDGRPVGLLLSDGPFRFPSTPEAELIFNMPLATSVRDALDFYHALARSFAPTWRSPLIPEDAWADYLMDLERRLGAPLIANGWLIPAKHPGDYRVAPRRVFGAAVRVQPAFGAFFRRRRAARVRAMRARLGV